MSTPARGIDLALLALGFTIWSAMFAALYGGHALGCAYGWHHLALGPTTLRSVFPERRRRNHIVVVGTPSSVGGGNGVNLSAAGSMNFIPSSGGGLAGSAFNRSDSSPQLLAQSGSPLSGV